MKFGNNTLKLIGICSKYQISREIAREFLPVNLKSCFNFVGNQNLLKCWLVLESPVKDSQSRLHCSLILTSYPFIVHSWSMLRIKKEEHEKLEYSVILLEYKASSIHNENWSHFLSWLGWINLSPLLKGGMRFDLFEHLIS